MIGNGPIGTDPRALATFDALHMVDIRRTKALLRYSVDWANPHAGARVVLRT
jgi:hypothetical protein